jgi:hypothetical protein
MTTDGPEFRALELQCAEVVITNTNHEAPPICPATVLNVLAALVPTA